MIIPEELRKDPEERRKYLNSCDVAFLCLPDAAAIEAVSMVENPDVRVIDTSTAHRTDSEWVYGFPELFDSIAEKLPTAKRLLPMRQIWRERVTSFFLRARDTKIISL
jgi:N-acetyl-gamma-glutamyl-phosphate reductase